MDNWEKFSKQVASTNKQDYSEQDIKKVLGSDPNSSSWDSLYALRNNPMFTKNMQFQTAIAPYEHRAFNREQVEASPDKLDAIRASVAQGVLTAGYTPAKVLSNVVGVINPELRFMQSRSQPSYNELAQGFAGIGDGLRNAFNR